MRRAASAALVVLLAAGSQAADDYARASDGTRTIDIGDVGIRVLVDASNLGGDEVELGEITFPAGHRSAGHAHGAVEIFYVLEGTLEHVVNGEAAQLRPGMAGIVRPGDEVVHATDDEPVRALVIWAPAGEAERLARAFDAGPARPREAGGCAVSASR